MGQESVSNEQQARSKKKRHSQPGLKLVIRRLPVGLTEAQLHTALDSHAWSKHVDRVNFIPGNDRKSFMRDGRAYLRWKGPKAMVGDFKRSIEEEVFPGEHVVVMYAPNRRGGAPTGKKNTLEGTIECDKGFKDFCAALEAAEGKPVYGHPVVSTQEEEGQGNAASAEGVKVTPLMEFLTKRHQDQVRNQNKARTGDSKGRLPKQKMMKENNMMEGKKSSTEEDNKNKGGNQRRKKKNQKKKGGAQQTGEEKKQDSSGGKPVPPAQVLNKKPAAGTAPKVLSRTDQRVPDVSVPDPSSSSTPASAMHDTQKKKTKKKKKPSGLGGKKPQTQ
ncbi:hypothetical protein M9434_004362 [Picochlorum sp. BPE23]|nr:hypothetical protein M9434_004362 [Picochlorum sp. BPE23]